MSDKRSSTAIPLPPPLPPQKLTAFARFVTQPFAAYGSRPPSAQANRGDGSKANSLPRIAGIASASSQDASHKTGLEITAIDINHERTHAILAGREILKTIRVAGNRCTEDVNLRAAILNYGAGGSARNRENLEIHDVKWSHGNFSTHIATAATNGKVILYDLNRSGVELAKLHEHHRQVHKLAFNPHQGYLLLSGSQDATVRLWDLRDMRREAMTCRSREKYAGLSEGVRDLKWSPTDGVEFAFGTDNGVIQRWDYRMNRSSKLKINAHDKACTVVDWHPDGKHMMSASIDKTVKVWDFASEIRRQKPAWVIRTPYPVWCARWRPSCWVPGQQDTGALHCTQIATSYDRDHPAIHIWDFRRPFLPFREIQNAQFKTSATDMVWHSRDLLWTVGKLGMFTQTDIHFASKVLERRNLQSFAVSPLGELAASVQKRSRRRNSAMDYASEEIYGSGDGREKRTSPEKSSFGRSSADDSVDNSFLSSSLKRHHGRTYSNRSTKSFGSTPPLSEKTGKLVHLNDSIEMHKEISQPNQVAFRGPLTGSSNIQVFSYLAQKYKAVPLTEPLTAETLQTFEKVFEQNAEYAQRAALYRLAETWRIIGLIAYLSVCRATKADKDKDQEHRVRKDTASSKPPLRSLGATSEDPHLHKSRSKSLVFRAVLGIDAHMGSGPIESTSNLTTPLARPVSNVTISNPTDLRGRLLPDLDHEDHLKLPPAVLDLPTSSSSTTTDDHSASNGISNTLWQDVPPDLDQRRQLMGNWRAQPRTPLALEPTDSPQLSITIPPSLGRNNSDDSFAMFSASTESRHNFSIPSSYASGSSHIPSASSMENGAWNGMPATSSFGNGRTIQNRNTNGQSLGVVMENSTAPIDGDNMDSHPSPLTVSTARQGNNSRADSISDVQTEYEITMHDIQTLQRQNQLLRHDSSESEAFLSSQGSFPYDRPIFTENMEASGTIVPEGPMDDRNPLTPSYLWAKRESTAPLPFTGQAIDKMRGQTPLPVHQTLGDDPSLFNVIDLLKNVITFHTTTLSDAQTPSVLLLLLVPLLPSIASDELGSSKEMILSVYSESLMNIGMSPMQIDTILSTSLEHLFEIGINPLQAESILDSYHTQLHSLGLFTAATSLRRLAYPTYPAVYEQALKETQLGFLCQKCNHPINNPRDKTQCETCKAYASPCPICWSRLPPFEMPGVKAKHKSRRVSRVAKTMGRSSLDHHNILSSSPGMDWHSGLPSEVEAEHTHCGKVDDGVDSITPMEPQPVLYNWCAVCGHGGHAACMETWFGDAALSEGACPVEGCLCDCVKGIRREERLRAIEARSKESQKGRVVKGDEWKVSESKAVGVVRGAMLAERRGEVNINMGDAITDGSGSETRNVGIGGSGNGILGAKKVRVMAPKK